MGCCYNTEMITKGVKSIRLLPSACIHIVLVCMMFVCTMGTVMQKMIIQEILSIHLRLITINHIVKLPVIIIEMQKSNFTIKTN